jgi:hypothetical protein
MPKDIMKEIKATIAKRMRSCETRVKYHKPLLFSALSANDITKVEVEFDGCGDSGQIENIAFYRGKGDNQTQLPASEKIGDQIVAGALIPEGSTWDEVKKEWVRKSKIPTITELIEQICYDLLEAYHGGWEINSGSCGTFQFNVRGTPKESSIALQYNERVESVEEYSEVY